MGVSIIMTVKKSKEKQSMKDRLQTQFENSKSFVETEGKRILNQLGADLAQEDRSLNAVLGRIRAKNPSLRKFVNNLDTATYDLRTKMNWDAHMISAYARLQVEKKIETVVKPKVEEYLQQFETRAEEFKTKAQEITARFNK